MFDTIFGFIVLTLFTWCIWTWRISSKGRFPPGPRALPVLGNLLDIVADPHLKFSEWAEKYGRLFRIKLGTQNAIVLSDPKVLRDILGKFVTTGRFKTDTYLIISKGPYGIINSEGKRYQELRNFCVQKLKTFGFGNRSVEPIISNEAESLIRWINEKNAMNTAGDGIHFADIMLVVSLNVLWTMVTGERISCEDSKITTLTHKYMEALQYTVKTGLGFYPWLRYLAPQASGYTDLKESAAEVRKYIEEQFDHHRKTMKKGCPRDLIDLYLEHLESVTDSSSGFFGEVGEINAVSSVQELFITGGDTLALTLTWALYYLCADPGVQEKLKEEIFTIIGPDSSCSLEHRSLMPYTEAVILETLRKSSLVPLGIFHETLDDLHYESYVFPKGTILIPNLYHIHHNKEIWGDPEQFRPERFLQGGNEKFRESLVAFQPGKRSCIGEPMAKDVFFLFLVNIIQHFEVSISRDIDIEQFLRPDVGIMLVPGKYKLRFKNRI